MGKKTEPKKTSAKTRLHAVPAPPPPYEPAPKLSDAQLEELRAHNGGFLDARSNLGALTAQYEVQKAQLVRAMGEHQKALGEKAKAFGTALGLDMEKENWTLNFQTGEYTKVEKPSV
jgi:hypothetical protein